MPFLGEVLSESTSAPWFRLQSQCWRARLLGSLRGAYVCHGTMMRLDLIRRDSRSRKVNHSQGLQQMCVCFDCPY